MAAPSAPEGALADGRNPGTDRRVGGGGGPCESGDRCPVGRPPSIWVWLPSRARDRSSNPRGGARARGLVLRSPRLGGGIHTGSGARGACCQAPLARRVVRPPLRR